MAFSLLSALSLTVIYRLTINLPDLPYSPDLARPGSDVFLRTSKDLVQGMDDLLVDLPGTHKSSVFQYRLVEAWNLLPHEIPILVEYDLIPTMPQTALLE